MGLYERIHGQRCVACGAVVGSLDTRCPLGSGVHQTPAMAQKLVDAFQPEWVRRNERGENKAKLLVSR